MFDNYNKNIIIFEIYLIIFAIIFFLSVYAFFFNLSLVYIDLPMKLTNLVIMALSSLAILKTLYHIITY
ncbi:MAG: hypothetical protein QXE31_05515 [Candidatus Woesearchaeota archaeon]